MCEGQDYEKLLKEVNKKVEELQVSIDLAYYFQLCKYGFLPIKLFLGYLLIQFSEIDNSMNVFDKI